MKCNGREAVTNFEPSTYEGEMITEGSNEGTIRSDGLYCTSLLSSVELLGTSLNWFLIYSLCRW